MRKIFGIMCHKYNPILAFTVQYLSSFENNLIILHVDNKSDISEGFLSFNKRVIIIADRVDVIWGNVSQIKATINLMREAIKYSHDYFFLISGDDIPLMTDSEMNIFLNRNKNYSYIHYQDERNNYINPLDRVKFNYPRFMFTRNKTFLLKLSHIFFDLTKKILFINKSLSNFKNIRLYKGTNWFTLRYDDLLFILEYISSNPKYLNLFDKSLCGDEVFFHSILVFKSDLKIYHDKSLLNDALRYIDWKSGPEYPRVLNENDIEKIPNNKYFFGRKISGNSLGTFVNKFIMGVN